MEDERGAYWTWNEPAMTDEHRETQGRVVSVQVCEHHCHYSLIYEYSAAADDGSCL